MPRVSIITPCYNAEPYIAATIESVRAQTFTDWEHIVVDDGSPDHAAEIVVKYTLEEPRLKLIRQPNGGVANARNNGYKAASLDSDYLYFLDADDVIEPNMLEVMIEYMDAHPEAGLTHCDFNRLADGVLKPHPPNDWPRYAPTRFWVKRLPKNQKETPFVSLFCFALVIPSLSIIRRTVYCETGGWDETFGQHFEDTMLVLKIALISQVHYLDSPLLQYRRHAGQSSSREDLHFNQWKKLYSYWRNNRDISLDQQKIVRDAFLFHSGRLVPYKGIHSGVEQLKKGRIEQALRFFGGAVRRYVSSYFAK